MGDQAWGLSITLRTLAVPHHKAKESRVTGRHLSVLLVVLSFSTPFFSSSDLPLRPRPPPPGLVETTLCEEEVLVVGRVTMSHALHMQRDLSCIGFSAPQSVRG
jgi:hypothetical protein